VRVKWSSHLLKWLKNATVKRSRQVCRDFSRAQVRERTMQIPTNYENSVANVVRRPLFAISQGYTRTPVLAAACMAQNTDYNFTPYRKRTRLSLVARSRTNRDSKPVHSTHVISAEPFNNQTATQCIGNSKDLLVSEVYGLDLVSLMRLEPLQRSRAPPCKSAMQLGALRSVWDSLLSSSLAAEIL
jgi:hypothetical protein